MSAGMRKQACVAIEASNIAHIGTDIDKKCRTTAASKEEQWKNAGAKEGLQVWRIENFAVKPIPQATYGQFFDGDSYIVLKTKGTAPKLSWDIHFWLGLETTADEAGTAAYKTVELDDHLGGAPIQHREVQGYESTLFLNYFPNHVISILKGGIDSAFNHVKPEAYRHRLLQIKGKVNIRLTEVPLTHKSLNSGDVFVLDAGTNLYQFNGKSASGGEKMKGASITRAIADQRDGRAKIHVAEEGDSDAAFWKVFWQELGGEGPIASAEAGGSDAVAAADALKSKLLFRLSDSSGKLKCEKIGEGKLNRSQLDSKDVFILDSGAQIFVWIGKGASAQEKRNGMGYAQDYVKDHNRPPFTPITRILEGGENEEFHASF